MDVHASIASAEQRDCGPKCAGKQRLAGEAGGKKSAWQKVDDRYGDIPAWSEDGTSARITLDFNWRPGAAGRHVLLAIATCDDDRANTDEATRLPCALLGAPLLQLVTGDNNLGLLETSVSAA